MNKVVSLIESQPVRMAFYPVVAGFVGYLAIRAGADADTANWIAGIVAAIFGIGATEAIHAKVTPVALAAKPSPPPTVPGSGPAADRHA
ncbi:hypothetical protein [Nocardia vaccinii]|uniref:hypothetical protein n=1 Tax=Nocardia vaccinii TaxID=1822 RepID=UPI000834C7DA|nr:hypothetical protein [Nocardia vaccinii]